MFPEIDEKEMRIRECQFAGCTPGDKRQGFFKTLQDKPRFGFLNFELPGLNLSRDVFET